MEVSIHAPRVGGDRSIADSYADETCFNPRPPRGGRRHMAQQTPCTRDILPQLRTGYAVHL